MNQIEIYNYRKKINEEKEKLEKKMHDNQDSLANLQNECPHKIILEFDDHLLHMVGRIIYCYCPACGKWKNIYTKREDEKSTFINSKFIDLTDFPLGIFEKHIIPITEYIFSNYDLYYSDDISENEITKAILNIVKKEEKTNEIPIIKKYVSKSKKDD